SEPSSVEISPDKTVAIVGLSVKGHGTDGASNRSLEVLRDDVVPATVGKLPNAEVAVTGLTAGSKDFLDVMKSHLPLVFAFVLSRVREAVDRGMSTDDAVAHGIKTTAAVVTSAALVMVAVFGAFALGSDQEMKQLGVGLSVAILIDATIVRAILLPATMKL